MNKVTFIIPGVGKSAKDYDVLLETLTQKGLNPVPIQIDWEMNSFSHWKAQAEEAISSKLGEIRGNRHYHRNPLDGVNIVGFSYGGLIASLLDAGMDTARTYCSVPDVFSDKDMRRKFDSITSRKAGVKPNWEEFDRLNQGVNFSFNSFLYGEKESPMYEQSARSLASRFQTDETEIHSVQEVGHDINSQGYATAIANLHNWLN